MIIPVQDFNIMMLSCYEELKAPTGKHKKKVRYLDCVCAFDIETSTDPAWQINYMYIWQFQLDDMYTIIGRRWYEFTDMLQKISDYLDDLTLVVYVHNLSYEWQYLKGLFDIGEHDVFASDVRRVIKFTALGNIEFRCSMMLSNMSLKQFTNSMHVEHEKLDGSDIYDVQYYPWSELPEHVLEYSTYDVIGLVEAVKAKMRLDGDTLYTVPLTSTGYPRRDMKRAMRYYPHEKLQRTLPDLTVYDMLTEAFRGGDTHANRYYSGSIVENVSSADRSSSYPDVMCNCMFPMGEWHALTADRQTLLKEMNEGKNALLIHIRLKDVTLKNKYNGDPYIPRDKCRTIWHARYDNGRVLEAEELEMIVTDIDFYIINHDYQWSDLEVLRLYASEYDFLPACFVKVITNYYEQKTKLKGDKSKDMEYNKAKALLNSLYGMMAMKVLRPQIIYRDGTLHIDRTESREELLKKAYSKAYSSYAWGCWVTSWSRYRLWEGIQIVGHERFIYCDTDSVKYVSDPAVSFQAFNAERKSNSIYSGSLAKDAAGQIHYMGVYEPDGLYKRFSTLGAKRYAYEDLDGVLHITIAGVAKEAGAKELEKLENFHDKFLFMNSGKTASTYVDVPPMDTMTYYEDGTKREIEITPYILISKTSYELNLTDEYRELIGLME